MQYTLVGNEDGSQNLTVFVEGAKPVTAHSSHPNWDAILAGVLKGDDSVVDLFDVALTAGSKFERLTDRITVANGRLYLDSEEVDNSLAEQVVTFLKDGVKNWQPLVAFFENVQSNPNPNSREQLYGWLTKEKLTITDDGMIVGYKGVKPDGKSFTSVHVGTAIVDGEVFTNQTIPNPIGAIVEMPRGEVDNNTGVDCSTGLHVGTYGYASTFADVCLEVEVNPRDVVSVPSHDTNKMRVCRYKVVKVVKKKYDTAVKPTVKTKNGTKVVSGTTQLKTKAKYAIKPATKPVEVRAVKKGDIYEDADKRRAGRTLQVLEIHSDGNSALVKSMPLDIKRFVKLDRLQSKKYKLVKKGRG